VFSQAFRELLRRHNITRAEIVRHCDFTSDTLTKMESGGADFNNAVKVLNRLAAIEHAAGEPPGYFLRWLGYAPDPGNVRKAITDDAGIAPAVRDALLRIWDHYSGRGAVVPMRPEGWAAADWSPPESPDDPDPGERLSQHGEDISPEDQPPDR
jgi:transcriptional regulator with XRE-family HTH domain